MTESCAIRKHNLWFRFFWSPPNSRQHVMLQNTQTCDKTCVHVQGHKKTVKRGFSSKEVWVLPNLWRFLRLCKVFLHMTNLTWGVTPSCWTIYVWPCSIVIIVCFLLLERQTQHKWCLYFCACFTDKECHHCIGLPECFLPDCYLLLLSCFATLLLC